MHSWCAFIRSVKSRELMNLSNFWSQIWWQEIYKRSGEVRRWDEKEKKAAKEKEKVLQQQQRVKYFYILFWHTLLTNLPVSLHLALVFVEMCFTDLGNITAKVSKDVKYRMWCEFGIWQTPVSIVNFSIQGSNNYK